jgi:hypothetical protein
MLARRNKKLTEHPELMAGRGEQDVRIEIGVVIGGGMRLTGGVNALRRVENFEHIRSVIVFGEGGRRGPKAEDGGREKRTQLCF